MSIVNTAENVFATLSKIDVSSFLEKKKTSGGRMLSYLSWANAWEIIMEHYPLASYSFGPEVVFDDGSVEVNCEVTIEGMRKEMFLPVMTGFTNSAVQNPNARDIGDAKMRCLVKCLAMFGLGLYVYRGEDIPKVEAGKVWVDGQPSTMKDVVDASNEPPSPPNTLDNKVVSKKQIDTLIRGAKIIASTDDLNDPELVKVMTATLGFCNTRRQQEGFDPVQKIQEVSYFDGERAIKYLAPKVRVAKEKQAIS